MANRTLKWKPAMMRHARMRGLSDAAQGNASAFELKTPECCRECLNAITLLFIPAPPGAPQPFGTGTQTRQSRACAAVGLGPRIAPRSLRGRAAARSPRFFLYRPLQERRFLCPMRPECGAHIASGAGLEQRQLRAAERLTPRFAAPGSASQILTRSVLWKSKESAQTH